MPGYKLLLDRAFVDTHDGAEEFQSVLSLTLERVATYDGAEATAIADSARLTEDLFVGSSGAAREDDDTTSIERALDNVVYTLSQGSYGYLVFLVDLLRLNQFNFRAWQFDLDDIRAKLGRNLGSVGNDINGGLSVLAQTAATRV